MIRAIRQLEQDGPGLGRPLVDRIRGSNLHNLKELRPPATSIRILFIFDRERITILLAAGDQARNWRRWYDTNISIAEKRYEDWI